MNDKIKAKPINLKKLNFISKKKYLEKGFNNPKPGIKNLYKERNKSFDAIKFSISKNKKEKKR
jgi:hypothetical protein